MITNEGCALNGGSGAVMMVMDANAAANWSSRRGMTGPHGCRASRPPESPSSAPGDPSDDTTVLTVHPRRAARRVAAALRRGRAVLVLTLAALAAPLATAQAQTVLWEQTMTVGLSGNETGWDDGGNYTGAALSDSDETFEYDGQTYDLSEILYFNFELVLAFNPDGAGDLATKATRDKLTFHVGTSAYNLGTAAFDGSRQMTWALNLSWSTGDMLALKITTTDPGAPGLTAMAGVAAVTLNWTAPTSSGDSAITGYEYRQRTGDDYAADAWTAIANSASLTSYEVTGLTGGSAYTFQLRARNSSGAGVYSAEVTTNAQAQTPSVLVIAFTSDPGDDDTYAIGDVLKATVTFGAAVTVTGVPQLALQVGAETRTADYESGTGSTDLVFSYTVAVGDEDTDGVAVEAGTIALNGGTIQVGTTAAALTHEAEAANPAHTVDGIRPTFESAETNEAGTRLFVTFSEPIGTVGHQPVA